MEDEILAVKVLLLGDASVGKTSLRRAYLGHTFKENYLQTLGVDFSHVNLTLNNTKLQVGIWDLAGQPAYDTIRSAYYYGAHGLILVYDLERDASRQNLKNWLTQFLQHSDMPKTSVLVIGNKVDLFDSNNLDEQNKSLEETILTTQQIFPKARVNGILSSALTGENVDSGFNILLSNLIKDITEE